MTMTQCTDGKMNYFKKYICFVDNIDNQIPYKTTRHRCPLWQCTIAHSGMDYGILDIN